MTKLNMTAETAKPQTVPAPANSEKHDDVKEPAPPLATPAGKASDQK